MQADGSAMYTVQALWTQARERLPVTTVVLSLPRWRGHSRKVGHAALAICS